ncbi:Adenylosuccinate synthetase [Anaerohalosphaera lusitana]|uniref:Adenylosuccinate synthetase n=1 Tax=Anaerohalosphaera lusitana TaxID=1936003 RepID=A0A1U9NI73_9BACT|nr:adenylosuccinate synthase [Anaerohalosphaera lusitana]AQT67621.1 Adenylosuccinate synthetase [Anaerohalosphaera lusitana]
MNCCVVGLQWGDEGKGKVVDILAEKSDIVARYGGGANAGHTVIIGDEKFALHIMPSGAVRPGTACVIGNGVVVDPEILIGEIEGLAERDISLAGRLFISESANVVLDYHKLEDRLREQSLGKDKIGTTARGIGPCYADKVGRSFAVRMSDFKHLDNLKQRLEKIIAYKNKVFAALYDAEPISVDDIFAKCRVYAQKLGPYIRNTTQYLHESIEQGKNILFEGAQGALLDLDHGTFPFVTSSNASALGMGPGCGVPNQKVDRFIGLVKAYTTRVGEGPFPTEQDNDTGQLIRDKGNEYGTTTGRPRRCGWFDGVATAYTARIGGITEVAMMHLDTLAGMPELKICKAYSVNGRETDFFPIDGEELASAECVYETLPGWDEDISGVQNFEDLPQNAKNYVEKVEQIIGVPVTMIGVGPKRSQAITRK